MTNPLDTHREPSTDHPAEPEPELSAEVIRDLDMAGGDADNVRGGFPPTSSVFCMRP